jgi:GntR family transcriptional regulator/MocR family aminotransferase
MGQFDEKARRSGATRKIVEALREQIIHGVYVPGDRLPSSRALASELGVSRTTVTAAFEQLISEGYVISRQGASNVVAELNSPDAGQTRQAEAVDRPRLSPYAERLGSLPPGTIGPRPTLPFDFRYGDISASDFPRVLWRRAMTGALLRNKGRLAYAHPAGDERLRNELRTYLWRARGIQCDADQIVVVSGSQQGVDLCTRLLVELGSNVVFEEPGYVMARHALMAAGAALLSVPCDMHGLDTTRLPDVEKVSLVFVTPSHQYPLGGVLPVGRREALLDWATVKEAYVLEDDYDGEYRYDVKPIPPLYLSGNGRVIYLGTVSKTLSPTLRLGYLVLPKHLVDVFIRCKQVMDRHSSALEQEALASMLESGAYERHVRKMRRANSERRAALIAALTDCFEDDIEIVGSSAGLHVVVWFKHLCAEDEPNLVQAALQRGIGIYPVAPLYLGQRPHRAGFVFGYASMSPGELTAGVTRLRTLIGRADPGMV